VITAASLIAQQLGLNVMPGYHTESANSKSECPKYDCFDSWKSATLKGFQHGFKTGAAWHPAVASLILLNEPDFFEIAPKCQPHGSWCRVKAAISALDGVLAAEREAGVSAGHVKLTVTWSFAVRTSIDSKVRGPGLYGFQDMVAAVQDPQIAHYTPRSSLSELREAFRTRWVHGLNTAAPWTYVKDIISKDYSQFLPTPWFIGEYGANGQDEGIIQADLMSMQDFASQGDEFLGAAVFQFQTGYWKGGAEMNFGLFSLGDEQIGRTGDVCDRVNFHCRSWPVYCLSTELPHLQGAKARRARAVANAWGGSIDRSSLCLGVRRLEERTGTKLACQINTEAVSGGVSTVQTLLSTATFEEKIRARTISLLGDESSALRGELSVVPNAVDTNTISPSEPKAPSKVSPAWKVWLPVVAVAALLGGGSVAVCSLVRGRKGHRQSEASAFSASAV